MAPFNPRVGEIYRVIEDNGNPVSPDCQWRIVSVNPITGIYLCGPEILSIGKTYQIWSRSADRWELVEDEFTAWVKEVRNGSLQKGDDSSLEE